MTPARRVLVLVLTILGVIFVVVAALVPTWLRQMAVQIPVDFERQTVLAGTGDLLDRSSIYKDGPLQVGTGLPLAITATTEATEVTTSGDLGVRTTSIGTKVGVPEALAEFHSAIDLITIDRRERTVVSSPEPTMQAPATTPAEATPARVGTYFTFPAGTPREDLPYFDTATHTPVTVRYMDDDRTVEGLEALHFRFEVIGHDMAESPAVGQPTRLTLPAAKWGLPGADPVTMNLYYTMVQDIWVEPVTGTVIDSALQPKSYFGRDPQDPQQVVVYAGSLRFTPETVTSLSNTARDGKDTIRLIFFWLPIGLAIVGVALLVAAVLLTVRGRRRAGAADTRQATETAPEAGDEKPTPVGSGR
ncbi:porin PorA family protein [Nocardia abscessus]|uniref:porin PorA family protein n=1 Tax=Nocardia abscessus TaxID=120957 RepID=UPI0024550072|nr:porin PorA family protein [Nocardia abscessus]